MSTHIVFYSSGLSSFYSAHRVISTYGADSTKLLFCDTNFEHEDNYRFLRESVEVLGVELITLNSGKNPYDVIANKKYFGNGWQAPCSAELKVKPAVKYIKANYTPDDVRLYVGIEWSESDRLEKIKNNWSPYHVESPLLWEPWAYRQSYYDLLQELNLTPPLMYKLGFSHANCSGCCIKAGKKQWLQALQFEPEKYAIAEATEEAFNKDRKKPYTLLRGVSLKELRESHENQLAIDFDQDNVACACFG